MEAFLIEGLHSPSRYYYIVIGFISANYDISWLAATNIATTALIYSAVAALIYEHMGQQYPYKLCEIRDRKSDISKRWYVEFYVFDIAQKKLVRKMDYSMNHLKTAKQRYKKCLDIKYQIDQQLIKGAFIDSSGNYKRQVKSNINEKTPLIKAIEIIWDEKALNTNSKRTLNAYTSYKNIFKEWSDAQGFDHLPIHAVNAGVVTEMMLWYKKRINTRTGNLISNKTRNNFFIQVRAIFNELVRREIIEESPAKNIEWLRESNQSHIPYMDEEAKLIKNYLRKTDLQMLMVCQCIYYLALRRSELRYLQVGHIRNGKIFLPESITYNGKTLRVSKSGKSQPIILPNQLKIMFEELKILTYPQRYFVFGLNGEPSDQPTGISYFNQKYKKVLLHLGFNEGQTMYSWKHTAACKLYNKFKDPEMIQRHFRHAELKTTLVYMRNLGLFNQGEIEEQYPDF